MSINYTLSRINKWQTEYLIIQANGDREAIKNWEAERPLIEKEVLKSLFKTIPTLYEIEFKKGNCIIRDPFHLYINKIKQPADWDDEESKSFLVEINLRDREMNLIKKVVSTCRSYCVDIKHLKRETYL